MRRRATLACCQRCLACVPPRPRSGRKRPKERLDSREAASRPERRAFVTPLAVVERECDLSMAGTAVLAFDIRKHREVDRAFRGTGEDFGVAEFTAVPNGMLLVREANGVNPRVTRL